MIYALTMLACTEADSEKNNGLSEPDTAAENSNEYWDMPDGYGSNEPVRLVVMGDSISFGEGASSGSMTYKSLLYENDPESWPDFDGLDLTTAYPSLTEFVDVAVGGATTSTLVNDQLPAAADALGDQVDGETVVVMTISGNDVNAAVTQLWYLLEVANDEEGAEEVVEELIERVTYNLEIMLDFYDDEVRFPDGSFVYMTNVYDPTDGTGDLPACYPGLDLSNALSYLDEINAALFELAEKRNVAMLDMHRHFLGHAFHHDDSDSPFYDTGNPEMWFADCVHPNDVGHNELRRIFYSAVTNSEFIAD